MASSLNGGIADQQYGRRRTEPGMAPLGGVSPPGERDSSRSMTTASQQLERGTFATKPVDALVAATEEETHRLKRSVGLLDLSALGLGAIIGTGIFVILGEAIGDSGPAIVLSFVLAGVTCAFSALSYAELGEFVAWIIGWDLILEYGVSVAAIAVGWGQYLSELLDSAFGFALPDGS